MDEIDDRDVQDLLDIEQDYQNELKRIQRTAQQAMEKAKGVSDAQAFVAALHQREVSLEEAAEDRQRKGSNDLSGRYFRG